MARVTVETNDRMSDRNDPGDAMGRIEAWWPDRAIASGLKRIAQGAVVDIEGSGRALVTALCRDHVELAPLSIFEPARYAVVRAIGPLVTPAGDDLVDRTVDGLGEPRDGRPRDRTRGHGADLRPRSSGGKGLRSRATHARDARVRSAARDRVRRQPDRGRHLRSGAPRDATPGRARANLHRGDPGGHLWHAASYDPRQRAALFEALRVRACLRLRPGVIDSAEQVVCLLAICSSPTCPNPSSNRSSSHTWRSSADPVPHDSPGSGARRPSTSRIRKRCSRWRVRWRDRSDGSDKADVRWADV